MKIPVKYFMCCCLWLQLLLCAVGSRVSIEPSVQTVAIGQNATLVCSTPIDQFVDWKRWTGEYMMPGIDFGRPNNGYGSKYITYTDAAGNHVLVITNVQIDDIGRYDCVDEEGYGEDAYANVNVVDIEMSTRESLLSDPGTEVGTTTITLIIIVLALVILIIVIAVVLRRICLSKAEKKICCCYSWNENPPTTDESLMKKSDYHGKVSVVIEN